MAHISIPRFRPRPPGEVAGGGCGFGFGFGFVLFALVLITLEVLELSRSGSGSVGVVRRRCASAYPSSMAMLPVFCVVSLPAFSC